MKRAVALLLVGGAAWSQPFPREKGDGPEWDAGVPFQSGLTRCRTCHDKDSVFEDTLYMPFDGWVSSMMGNSQRDPLFKAAVAVANQDAPGVGQWCLRCHSPQAFINNHVLPPDGGALDDLDKEGVTCDVCHRSIVTPTEPLAPFVGNAQLYFDTSIKKFGPYGNVYSPGHDGEQSSFTGSSEMCGQCHSVHNPVRAWKALDGGTLGTRFPLDTTYQEWKQSAFAKRPPDAGFSSCADCHLPRFTGPDAGVFYRVGKGIGVPDRANPRQHALAGGNLWGLDAVQALNPAIAADFAAQFALTKKFTIENLKGAAALTLTVPSAAQTGSAATVTVRVTNRTGHKLPTGYADGRRVVVQLLADGEVVTGGFDAGALLKDAQSRVYEAQHGRLAVGVSEHLALHEAIFKDSRIPPTAMTPTEETRPVGVTWFDQPDGGLRDYDEATFTVPLKASLADGAKVKVTARLMFQSTTPEYVEFLAAENHTDDAGRQLLEIYNATGRGAPFEMAIAEGELTVSRPIGTGGGSGGSGGAGGGNLTGSCNCQSGPGFLGLMALLYFLSLGVRTRAS